MSARCDDPRVKLPSIQNLLASLDRCDERPVTGPTIVTRPAVSPWNTHTPQPLALAESHLHSRAYNHTHTPQRLWEATPTAAAAAAAAAAVSGMSAPGMSATPAPVIPASSSSSSSSTSSTSSSSSLSSPPASSSSPVSPISPVSSAGASLPPKSSAALASRRTNLPKKTVEILNEWLVSHLNYPYPSPQEKRELLAKTGLSKVQLSNWFINVRRRKVFSDYYLMSRPLAAGGETTAATTTPTGAGNTATGATSTSSTAIAVEHDKTLPSTTVPFTRRKKLIDRLEELKRATQS
ncbi:LAME_0C08460g1_1 [Lachancea meyersii CBS 8951]|uniref:LAME_0C08460g1_1 n=1 Tax=Lachancea meyersii CBS 8951 TaxID=1266667 RepID=A0A1G4J336_9SACH|nr:LAME_0C08460g1_1 [Lachancea meyersii CBS 8951]